MWITVKNGQGDDTAINIDRVEAATPSKEGTAIWLGDDKYKTTVPFDKFTRAVGSLDLRT